MGDPRASENRPDRLPLAHSPLRRSTRGFSVCRSVRCRRCGRGLGGAPFDIEDVFWSHRGDAYTFDTMVEEFGLGTPPLLRLANMVRGADTARPELSPEAPGLLAASLGLSRMYADDLQQLEAGMLLYEAFYRWCRDATDETHNWPTNKPREPEMNEALASPVRSTVGETRSYPFLSEAARTWARVAASELRRTGRADRGDASASSSKKSAGYQKQQIPTRSQLLHAPARSRGAAARDLYRLADAPHSSAGYWPEDYSSFPASSASWA